MAMTVQKKIKEKRNSFQSPATSKQLILLQIIFFSILIESIPRFTRVPSDANVTVGEEVSLHCRAGGVPQPEIFWTRNNQPLVTDERTKV